MSYLAAIARLNFAALAALFSVVAWAQTPDTNPTNAAQRLFGAPAQPQTFRLPQAPESTTPLISRNPQSNEPLPTDQAFVLSAKRQNGLLQIGFTIAEGYYLYKEKISIKAPSSLCVAALKLPKGVVKYDETFAKDVETYRSSLQLPAMKLTQPLSQALTVDVYSQGCADIGICYPPQLQRLFFAPDQSIATVTTLDYVPNPGLAPDTKLTPALKAAPLQQVQPAQPSSVLAITPPPQNILPVNPIDTGVGNSESDRLGQLFTANNPLLLSLAFTGFGLLLAFTPCVLPMVPIVSAIVLGSNRKVGSTEPSGGKHERSKLTGFLLSLAYVLGMCITYTAMGVAAGLAGAGFSAFLQQPCVLVAFAVLMTVLAGAQFGWYEIKLPSAWFERLSAQQNQYSAGQYIGALVMGALSAIMVGPCVTAPLAGALAYIAQSGNAWTGALALFSLSLGMGLPLLLIGAGGAAMLPKTGVWMNQVTHGFGLMLLGVALWMVQSLLPAWLSTLGWVVLCLMLAVLFGVLMPLTAAISPASRFFKGLSYLLLVWAAAITWGAAGGRYDALTPLAASANGKASSVALFETVPSHQLTARLEQAKGSPIILDMYADWCVSCIEFERYTFSDPSVAAALQSFTRLKVDVTKNTASDQALLKQLALFGPPAILFYNQAGVEMKASRVIGFQAAPSFLKHLQQVLDKNR
jgi:thioredoxin:protein disulfide reductase